MPSYSDIKSHIETLVATAYASDPDSSLSLYAALGRAVPDSYGKYPTITIGTGSSELKMMVGSAWGPALDRTNPELGPDPLRVDNTPFALIVKGLAEWFDNEWKGRINDVINDYNARFATSFDTLS